MLRRPSLRSGCCIVVPPDAPMGQTLAREFSRAQHARNGQHGLRRGCVEYPAKRLVDATVQLSGRGSGRHREVEAGNHSRREQPCESPQGRLGLARAGLGFENHEPSVWIDATHRCLCRIRFGKVGQLREARSGSGGECTGVETNRRQCLRRDIVRQRIVVRGERGLEYEELSVRSDPVRQSGQPRDLVAETWGVGKVSNPGLKSSGEPALQGIAHPPCFHPPVVVRQRRPFPKGRSCRRLHRASVVGEHRPHERGHRLAPVENPPNRRVERVFGPLHGQRQERPAFLQMPGGRTFPATGRPTLRLKARVQLSDVVKERQGGESPARRFGQCGIRRHLQAIANDRQLQHSREHRRHVHRVMSEGMRLAAVLVGFAPSLEHRHRSLETPSPRDTTRPSGVACGSFAISHSA